MKKICTFLLLTLNILSYSDDNVLDWLEKPFRIQINPTIPAGPLSVLDIIFLIEQDWDKPSDELLLKDSSLWPKVRDSALITISKINSSNLKNLNKPKSRFCASLFNDYRPTLEHSIKKYTSEKRTTISLFSSILDEGTGGIPTPHPLQIGLSQIVVSGQPGMQVNLAGNPWAKNRNNKFLRHFNCITSAMVLNPSELKLGEDNATVEPLFASGEIYFSHSSRRTVYDWACEVSKRQESIDSTLDEIAWSATKLLLKVFSSYVSNGSDTLIAVKHAISEARKLYIDATEAYLIEQFVKPETNRKWISHHDYAINFRASPHAEYLTEMHDFCSFGGVFCWETVYNKDTSSYFH